MKRILSKVMLCSIGTLGMGVPLVAQGVETVELPASRDNTLFQSDTGSLSNGAGDAIFAGRTAAQGGGLRRRAVLAFDLSSIPQGATITQVSLRLRNSSTANNGTHPFELFALTKDWGEGTSNAAGAEGGGAAATTGDATWLHTFFNTDLWDSGGGDFAAVPSASVQVGANGLYSWTSQGMIDDVQGWVDNPSTNFGWIVIGNEGTVQTAKRFNSRESSSDPPLLTVSYQAPAQADPGVIEFEQETLTVNESAGVISVAVRRSGGTEGEVSIQYTTVDDVALAGEDYVAAAGALVFADGEGGTKNIEVTILDDADEPRYEGVEGFNLVLSNPTGGAVLGDLSEAQILIDDEEDLAYRMYFSQFGDGDGFFSQVILVNPSAERSARARIVGLTDSGEPFLLNTGGAPVVLDEVVDLEAEGTSGFETSGAGPLQTGSVTVLSDAPLSGVILFGGDFGLAGVPAAGEFPNGFVGPVDVRLAENIRTGVSIQNLEEAPIEVVVDLLDASGVVVASALLEIPALGKEARFVEELEWDSEVDFELFQGTIRAAADGSVSALMIQNRLVGGVSQFATLPVTERP